MVEMALHELRERMDGTILQGSPDLRFRRYNIDSRTTQPGELFFAIQAERNGHEFVLEAVRQGAGGAVISLRVSPPGPETALVQVNDTLEALQKLAGSIASTLRPRVVGITGSVGKTTTKEFTARLLANSYSVLKSEGNFNNHLGLPLSLLQLEEHHDVAVLEYGMSTPGEIAALTRIVPPDIALITNVRPVHLEFFPDIRGISRAKQELLDGAAPGGVAVLNRDDPLVAEMAAAWRGETVFFGLSDACTVRALNIRPRGWDGVSFDLAFGSETRPAALPFFNRGQLYNFLGAAAVARVLGVPLEEVAAAASQFEAFDKRGRSYRLDRDIRLIDDSYNSNPSALEEALKALAGLPGGRKLAVLGDMLELGHTEADFHAEAGELACSLKIDLLVLVGPLTLHTAEAAAGAGMDPERILVFTDSTAAAEALPSLLEARDVILVKGSRGMRMEAIVQKLLREKG
jgi:UDP-N-acetylmuramoyl-tripeptide--D-alanyl-D-alanine ligase